MPVPEGRANSFIGEIGPREPVRQPVHSVVRAHSEGQVNTAKPLVSLGLFKGRYKDHPRCDLCSVQFEATRRRHQCRRCGVFVCSGCSPMQMLVPWVEQFEGAKTFDQATPQRVCLPCSNDLRPLQAELAATYGRANLDNTHVAKSRLHLPYTWSLAEECQHAADIIGNFYRQGGGWKDNGAKIDQGIPASIFKNAKGLAIMTTLKTGFTPVCAKLGTGLVVRRLADGSWSAPSAISMFGAGGGVQLGGELTETVLVLGSDPAVDVFCDAQQINLGAGVDVAVGPFGRSISVAGAATLQGGISGNYGYSQSRGLCFGMAFEGAVISVRGKINRRFYGQDLTPRQILSGDIEKPAGASPLYEALDEVMRQVEIYEVKVRAHPATSITSSEGTIPN